MNLIKKRPNIESSSIILVILVIVFAGAFFYLDSSSTGFAFLEPEITVQPEIAAEKAGRNDYRNYQGPINGMAIRCFDERRKSHTATG